jgi:hypothetical protein
MKMATIASPWRYDVVLESTLSYPISCRCFRMLRREMCTRALFHFNVLDPGPTSRAQAVSGLFDAAQEARVMLETVFEPVLFGLEADQHACRLAMACDDDSCVSASRRNRDRSSLISDRGTSFIPDLRTVRAMTRPPIWPRSPKPRRSCRKRHRTPELRPPAADTVDAAVLAGV